MSAPTAARKNSVPLTVPQGQTPVAEGTLEQTPLLHLYVYLLDKSLSGTTVLTPPSGFTVGLFVQDGSPTRAQMRDGTIAQDRVTLERALVDLCLLPADTRYAFFPRADFFEFTETPAISIDPLAAIMSAARACIGSTFASATLRKVMKASSVKVANHASPERFRLSPEERTVIERIRQQTLTLPQLISTSDIPEQVVRSVVYGLTITRHLDFGVPARPPVGIDLLPRAAAAAQVSSSTRAANTGLGAHEQNGPEKPGPRAKLHSDPESSNIRPRLNSELELIETAPSPNVPIVIRATETASPDKRRDEVESKITRIATENHFEVLGIKENASLLEIRDAYFGMAKMFHPDRLADMPDLRQKAQAAFARISVAYNELSDDKKRAAYIAKLKTAGEKGTSPHAPITSDAQTVGRAINAALEAQKAELLLKKNELATAESHAKMATLADPDQPAYVALLAWIQAQQRPVPTLQEGKTSSAYDDLIGTLEQLLRKEPNFERALFYRGVLLQRSGHTERAFKDFSRALELNPRNIDAAREVRLYKLRHKDKPEDSSPSNSGGGIFGKLFKR
jgi:curved DNA-binding protein CbpA